MIYEIFHEEYVLQNLALSKKIITFASKPKITYNDKKYKAELNVKHNTITINVNGDASLTVKDFPFDGRYQSLNSLDNSTTPSV